MKWLGTKLKDLIDSKSVTQSGLAQGVGVTRQTVVDWIKGQVPKGSHLLGISRILDVEPSAFFEDEPSPVQVAPRFRKRRTAKITAEVEGIAQGLALEYAGILEAKAMPVLEHIVRRIDDDAAVQLASCMRQLAGLRGSHDPMGYQDVFYLMQELGICVIFRKFPDDLKDYAFYTVINGQRVVFVNSATNLLDLIFPMLHEAVHALIDPAASSRCSADKEDSFCDKVAGMAQYPDGYVDDVCAAIKGRTAAVKVNMLKDFAVRNHHVVYGIVRRIEERHGKLKLSRNSVHGADGNLRQQSPQTLYDALFGDEAEGYVRALQTLTPIWFGIVAGSLDAMTIRKLADVLGLESVLDAKEVREEIERMTTGEELHACSV